MSTRVCNRCHRLLPIDQFPLRGRGHSKICRSCHDVQTQSIPLPQGIDPVELQVQLEALKKLQDNQNRTLFTLLADKFHDMERRLIEDEQNRQRELQIQHQRNEQTRNEIRELGTYIGNVTTTITGISTGISTQVDGLSNDVNELKLLVQSIGESNKDLAERLEGIVIHQTKAIENIKEEVDKIASPIIKSPTLSTTQTPIETPIATPPPRSPPIVIQNITAPQKISFSGSNLTNDYIRSLSDKDLRKHINTASSTATYYKQLDEEKYKTSKKNSDELRKELNRRKGLNK